MKNVNKRQGLNKETGRSLERRLTLPLLILYGLGVTVGAGIYVLVGLTAERAGFYAPVAFLLAAIIILFTAFTYSELSSRYPVSAGEAAYVNAGLNARGLSLLIGVLVAVSGIVSSATILIGAGAYIQQLLPLSPSFLIVVIALTLSVAAMWGILESVSIAAAFTILELVGLGVVIFYGFSLNPDLLGEIGRLVPPFDASAWAGISSAGLLAFFAFIGFEDLANVAEEAVNPQRNMPLAMLVTIFIATVIYLIVVSVVVLSVPMEALSASASPLTLVFENASDAAKGTFTVVAAMATLNGVLIQMIMSSRVLYGLADRGQLPKCLAYIHPKTRTPLIATAIVTAAILALALFLPMDSLAQMTSQVNLVVFSFVNLALIVLKMKKRPVEASVFQVPIWVPIIGLISSIGLLLSGFL